MSVLFISDLHLAPERPEVTRAFLSFLSNRASAAKALYILGDLFEAWIGDDEPTELAAEVQDALRKLSDSGVDLYVQQGNRDFLLGNRFSKRCGAVMLGDEHIVEYAGHRALAILSVQTISTINVSAARRAIQSTNGASLTFPLSAVKNLPLIGGPKVWRPTVTKRRQLWMLMLMQ
jgi:UDP-2,3-diacylglucosamine hydrolase